MKPSERIRSAKISIVSERGDIDTALEMLPQGNCRVAGLLIVNTTLELAAKMLEKDEPAANVGQIGHITEATLIEEQCDIWLEQNQISPNSPEGYWATKAWMKARGYEWPEQGDEHA